ncbi:hypothetical protein [Cryptosporangium minutisporangium]|uniref:Uncharacterized protein n=1 Tax=Cryptosporangium minutisporangium TaxID=113569 RepID=A0ABP6T1Y0_9ACTN
MAEAHEHTNTERQAPDETPDRNPVADPMDPAARVRAGGLPPTMPEEARTGYADAPTPEDYPVGSDPDLAEKAGGVPAGTAPEVTTAPGTSESMRPVEGVHTPDVGPGGRDIDTASRPLTQRPEAAR